LKLQKSAKIQYSIKQKSVVFHMPQLFICTHFNSLPTIICVM